MAVCEIWKIESRLDRVIKYTTNEDKTENIDVYDDLHKVLNYDKNDLKTEKQLFVSGINCNPNTALEEMINTKRHYNKTTGILGYHAFQSFNEGEVTPEIAHNIGVKLADEMWGDRFEVVVSTHLNTKHYHNHFVINSVSFRDGKKFYDTYKTYAELRHTSDSICKEMGLSVLEEQKTRKGINYSNHYKKYVNTTNYHTITKEDIDSAIKQAYSYYDFERILSAMGYDLTYRSGKLSVRHNAFKKNIRLVRAYGDDYSKENIIKRINEERCSREAIPLSKHILKKYNKNKMSFSKMFLHYYWLLKVVPKKYPTIYVSPLIRSDVNKMNLISNEAKLLVSNKINTHEEFFSYRETLTDKFNSLKDERDKLWKQSKSKGGDVDKNKIINRINEINKELVPIRKKVDLCRDIEERHKTISERIKEQEKDKERMIVNESR